MAEGKRPLKICISCGSEPPEDPSAIVEVSSEDLKGRGILRHYDGASWKEVTYDPRDVDPSSRRGGRESFYKCPDCQYRDREERVDMETSHTEHAVCPYCLTEQTDSFELGGTTGEVETEEECQECEETYVLRRRIEVTYDTEKVDKGTK